MHRLIKDGNIVQSNTTHSVILISRSVQNSDLASLGGEAWRDAIRPWTKMALITAIEDINVSSLDTLDYFTLAFTQGYVATSLCVSLDYNQYSTYDLHVNMINTWLYSCNSN